jgi:hypothetical protein
VAHVVLDVALARNILGAKPLKNVIEWGLWISSYLKLIGEQSSLDHLLLLDVRKSRIDDDL